MYDYICLTRMKIRDCKLWLCDKITRILIYIIKKINPYKDNSLSFRLEELADKFSTRSRK